MNNILRIGKALIWKQFRESAGLVIPLLLFLCVLVYLSIRSIGSYDPEKEMYTIIIFIGMIILTYSWFISNESEKNTFNFIFSHPLKPILYLTISFAFSFVLLFYFIIVLVLSFIF